MRRLEFLSASLALLPILKWAGFLPSQVTWFNLVVVLLAFSYLLNIDLARKPITHLNPGQSPRRYLGKMLAVRDGKNSGNPIRIHLISGLVREGRVIKYNMWLATFTLEHDERNPDCRRHYEADNIDEVEVLYSPDQVMELPNETDAPAEGT